MKKQILDYIARNELMDKVCLIEKVPNRMMRHYYSNADLLLLFSKVEIFGMVILEAMACGCPVIATAVPGALDVIRDGENGFIIKGDNPFAIAERIHLLLKDGARLTLLKKAALEIARENYSWEIIARQYYNIYCES